MATWRAFIPVVILPIMTGCEPPLVSVEGTVTLDGIPVKHSTVEFIPESGNSGYNMVGESDSEGRYFLNTVSSSDWVSRKGCYPGSYRVTIYYIPMIPPRRQEAKIPTIYTSREETPFVFAVPKSGGVIDLELTSVQRREPDPESKEP